MAPRCEGRIHSVLFRRERCCREAAWSNANCGHLSDIWVTFYVEPLDESPDRDKGLFVASLVQFQQVVCKGACMCVEKLFAVVPNGVRQGLSKRWAGLREHRKDLVFGNHEGASNTALSGKARL